jgi:hypothetical protein
MQAILGGADTVTGSADPYTHSCSLQNSGVGGQPPTYTLFVYNGAECWQMAGSKLGKCEVDLKADDLGNIAADWTGLAATKLSSVPTNTPSTAMPWSGTNTVITVAGVTATTYSDVKLSYTRAVEPILTATGTPTPYAIFADALEVAIDVQGVYTGYTGSELEKLINNTHPIVTVKCNASNDATHYGLWTHSVTAPTTAKVKHDSKYVEIDSTFMGIANATDAIGGSTSPVKFSLLTASATVY